MNPENEKIKRREFLKRSALLIAGTAVTLFLPSLGCTSENKKKKRLFSVDSAKCKGCEDCIGKCEHEAISMNGNKAVSDKNKCRGCGDCAKECRHDAILETA